MGAEEIEFEHWWSDFLAECEGHRDPYLSIEALRRYIAGLSDEKRTEFERCLVDLIYGQQAGAGVALGALERAALPETHEALAELARQASPTSADLREGALRALARSDLPQSIALLEDYLLHEPIGRNWSSVPWSLWPQTPVLFCRAWSRFFSERPAESWRGSAIVQAFLTEPPAVRLLRQALQAENPTAWAQFQAALVQASHASWLNETQRAALLAEVGA